MKKNNDNKWEKTHTQTHIKNLKKKKKKKTMHYQLGLKSKIKSNKTFIKKLRKKRNHKNNDQIKNTNIWWKKSEHVEFIKMFF
jgi:hypothetical protein